MSPQYLAGRTSYVIGIESFLTQRAHFAVSGYVSPNCSSIMAGGHTHVAGTSCKWQVAPLGCGLSGTSNRRNRCRRTSRACWSSAWLPSWQPARSRKKKNSSWSIPSPFRWSRATPASTSKTGAGPVLRRMAPGSVPPTARRGLGQDATPFIFAQKSAKSSVYMSPEVEKCIDIMPCWPLSALSSWSLDAAVPHPSRNPFMSNRSMVNTAPLMMVADVSAGNPRPALRPATIVRRRTTSACPIRPGREAARQAVVRPERRRAADVARAAGLEHPRASRAGQEAVAC